MRTVIAVPVKDEAERIGTCLTALLRQREVQANAIVLVVNNTRDATAAIARGVSADIGWGGTTRVEVIEVEFPPERASAGSARRMAMERAAELAGEGGVLLTTDADGRVPPDWLAANLFHLRRGADAVAGRAVLEPGDAAAIPERLHADDALECAYAAALDEIAAVMMPQAWDPWPRHTEHSGASIAVTLAAYRLVGGMPAAPISEDRRFFAALRVAGVRIRHAPEIEVVVSGRTVGRAEGGMADTIRRRLRRADPYLDDALEPALDFWRRLQGNAVGKRRLVSAEAAVEELAVARWILAELRVEAGLAKVATP